MMAWLLIVVGVLVIGAIAVYSAYLMHTITRQSGWMKFSLNVWLRCGCKPNAAHIRRIVVWEKPVSAAIERIDQCVASVGVVRNVRSITAAT